MLGWHISVFKQPDGGGAPARVGSPTGERIAVWQTGLGGLDWIDELVKKGKAIRLGGHGYPCLYTVTAKHLIPTIMDKPPKARDTWVCEPSDILTEQWAGKTVIDRGEAIGCRPDEWLIIEAWDESWLAAGTACWLYGCGRSKAERVATADPPRDRRLPTLCRRRRGSGPLSLSFGGPRWKA
jgi:hypothetical protein